jgi:Fic family protein
VPPPWIHAASFIKIAVGHKDMQMSKSKRIMTLGQFSRQLTSIPTAIVWMLSDLAESRGKQELFTNQSPQKLKVLREHALIESTVSSNRIEGVTVDQARIGTLVFGRPRPRDRNEEELQGYRKALNEIHQRAARLPVTQRTIRRLHQLSYGPAWDAGRYKKRDIDIIETYANGRSRIRFKSVSARQTPEATASLVALWKDAVKQRWGHPLIALAGFNLDFLCIHPFRDGNGRVSRLLLLLQCYHHGYEVGRYISLERLIEQNKERYYETLEQSSLGWHEGKHDPWPFVGYLLFVLREAYKEFETRVGQVASPRGAKTAFVTDAVRAFSGPFTLADLERACPGVSRDMVRRVLRNMQRAGHVECLGRGPGATWRRKGSTPKKG